MPVGADNIHLLHPAVEVGSHRIFGSLHATHSRIGWVVLVRLPKEIDNNDVNSLRISSNNCKDVVSDHESDEHTDDNKLAMSNNEHLAIQIVEESITRMNDFKFQIAVPFRYINSILFE